MHTTRQRLTLDKRLLCVTAQALPELQLCSGKLQVFMATSLAGSVLREGGREEGRKGEGEGGRRREGEGERGREGGGREGGGRG